MKKLLFFFVVIFISSTNVFSYRPIYFNRAATLKQNNLTMRIYYLKTFFNSKYDVGTKEMVDIPDNIELNFNAFNIFFSYGLINRVTIGLNSVYKYQEIDNSLIKRIGEGFGDISTLIKISLIKKTDLFFSPAIFIKWNNAKYKDLKATELALGTGTIDTSIKLLTDIKIYKVWLYIIPTYTFDGKNDLLDKGDSISMVITASFPIWKKIYGEISVNGDYKFYDKTLSGDEIENSETYNISGSFGIQYALTKKVFLQGLGEYIFDTKDTWGRCLIIKTGVSTKF